MWGTLSRPGAEGVRRGEPAGSRRSPRILRRAGYKGELRAVGQPARDQLGYMERCGINAFEFDDQSYSDDFLTAFDEISVRYQGSADDPRPIYLQN